MLLCLRRAIKAHDLCHNLHGKVDAIAFAEGCEAEQRKLYGCAPHADGLRNLYQENVQLKNRLDQESSRKKNNRRTMWD